MGKKDRLIDQLQNEIRELNDKQREAFKQSLKRQLPTVIKQAAQDAKKENEEERSQ